MHCLLSCCVQLRNSGALVIAAMLDFMTFALCAPYSETTDGTYFDVFLDMVATEGRAIFKLFQVRPHLIGLVFIRILLLLYVWLSFKLVLQSTVLYKILMNNCILQLYQHPSVAIVKGAGLVMKAVIEVSLFFWMHYAILLVAYMPKQIGVKKYGTKRYNGVKWLMMLLCANRKGRQILQRGCKIWHWRRELCLATCTRPCLLPVLTVACWLSGVCVRLWYCAIGFWMILHHMWLLFFCFCYIYDDCCHRQLSRHLVGLWVTGHPTAMALLRRILVSWWCCHIT